MQCMISIVYACTGLKRVQIGYKKRFLSWFLNWPGKVTLPQPALKMNRNLEVQVMAKDFLAPKATEKQ